MELPMQLIFGVRCDLYKLQICAKGKFILEFNSVLKKIQKKSKNIKTWQKSTKKWFDRAALWRVYIYLISSTSMQMENPFRNFVGQIKIRCAKYKFAEGSHNFLMERPMQLIFGVRSEHDKLQICAKGKSILEFHSVWNKIQKIQKIAT